MQAKQLGLPLSLKSLHRMMQLNDMTDMDFDEENEQIETEAESLIGMMVHGANVGDGLDRRRTVPRRVRQSD
jgi:hypothetical protein